LAAYRWIIDSRDEYQEERLENLTGIKLSGCYQIGACSLACPKGLDPRDAIYKLQNLYKEYLRKKEENILIR
jgi:succinate dehydrogenase/fumarate reductase-like Fe-S protein